MGVPEQLTAGPTEEEGISASPDGTSLVTSVGTRRISLVLHDGGAERALVAEGRPRIAPARNGSAFSIDGKKLYFLQIAPGSNDVGDAMLTAFTAGDLWVVDVDTGQAAVVFPGLKITRFSLAPDGKRITFTTADADGPHLWVAALDRQSPPRQLPVVAPEEPRFARESIYYVSRQPAPQGAPVRPIVHRIRADGTSDEPIFPKDFRRLAVSPSGRYLAVTRRGYGNADVIGTEIVDWQTGSTIPICRDCSGWWSDDGASFTITRQDEAGDTFGLYVLPARGDSELPDVPDGGFRDLDDTTHVKGARVINHAGDVVLDAGRPDRYAFIREIVHRNLYRIRLP
jgi:hypothetical protein